MAKSDKNSLTPISQFSRNFTRADRLLANNSYAKT